MKRLMSTDVDELVPNKRSTRSQNKHNDIGLNLNDFKLRIPNLGEQLVNEKNNQLGFNITDTCTIDYFLLSLWACSRIRTKIKDTINCSTFMKKQDFINIINSIEFLQWNKAKSIWILNILLSEYSFDCNCEECIVYFPKTKSISTYGSEYEEFFRQPIIEIQKYTFLSFCSNNCDLNDLIKESVSLTFEKVKSNVILLYTNKI